MIRTALRQAGENDRGLADYVTAIVLNFGIRGRAYRIADSDDEVYDAIVDLCEDLNDPDARRSFLVRTHLGNYALWVSGIFPDFIEHRRTRRGGPDLEYYEAMGRRGFQLAAGHRLAEEHGLTTLFANAAAGWPAARGAQPGDDTLFFPNVCTPERLMRQCATSFAGSGRRKDSGTARQPDSGTANQRSVGPSRANGVGKRGEQATVPRFGRFSELFRVPLDRDQPPVVGLRLERFDDSIGAYGGCAKRRCEAIDGLVVRRVHRDRRLADDAGQ
jgi:hypothetical protein